MGSPRWCRFLSGFQLRDSTCNGVSHLSTESCRPSPRRDSFVEAPMPAASHGAKRRCRHGRHRFRRFFGALLPPNRSPEASARMEERPLPHSRGCTSVRRKRGCPVPRRRCLRPDATGLRPVPIRSLRMKGCCSFLGTGPERHAFVPREGQGAADAAGSASAVPPKHKDLLHAEAADRHRPEARNVRTRQSLRVQSCTRVGHHSPGGGHGQVRHVIGWTELPRAGNSARTPGVPVA